MKTKWCFSGFIAFMLLFVVNQQKETIPNQEIEFEFSELVSSQEIVSFLKGIEFQLKIIGATNIKFVKDLNTGLKLNYFCNQTPLKVEYLLQNLDKKNNTKLSLSKLISTSTIKLKVYEINVPTDPISGFEHKVIIEYKSDFDHSIYSNTYAHSGSIKYIDLASAIQYTKILKGNDILFLSNTRHNTPRVRAGPLC